MANWKTTLIGIGGAIAIGTGNILQGGDASDAGTWINMVITALLGWFAKDHNVTGGSVMQ